MSLSDDDITINAQPADDGLPPVVAGEADDEESADSGDSGDPESTDG